MDPYVVEEDPGVKSVRNIYDYYTLNVCGSISSSFYSTTLQETVT